VIFLKDDRDCTIEKTKNKDYILKMCRDNGDTDIFRLDIDEIKSIKDVFQEILDNIEKKRVKKYKRKNSV
jgi:hypothetical protein